MGNKSETTNTINSPISQSKMRKESEENGKFYLDPVVVQQILSAAKKQHENKPDCGCLYCRTVKAADLIKNSSTSNSNSSSTSNNNKYIPKTTKSEKSAGPSRIADSNSNNKKPITKRSLLKEIDLSATSSEEEPPIKKWPVKPPQFYWENPEKSPKDEKQKNSEKEQAIELSRLKGEIVRKNTLVAETCSQIGITLRAVASLFDRLATQTKETKEN
uniref:Uncharacterized protein n=1 Tax=Meloidogyne hapla TaxID=6305 RepID=A0A1I8BAE6_MELHA